MEPFSLKRCLVFKSDEHFLKDSFASQKYSTSSSDSIANLLTTAASSSTEKILFPYLLVSYAFYSKVSYSAMSWVSDPLLLLQLTQPRFALSSVECNFTALLVLKEPKDLHFYLDCLQ